MFYTKPKYIQHLTEEDIDQITNLCFGSQYKTNCFFPQSKPVTDHILVSLYPKGEFDIDDFTIHYNAECTPVSNYQDLFVTFMYEKFGEEYLTEYALQKCRVNIYQAKLNEAQENLNNAKYQSIKLMDYIKQYSHTRNIETINNDVHIVEYEI